MLSLAHRKKKAINDRFYFAKFNMASNEGFEVKIPKFKS